MRFIDVTSDIDESLSSLEPPNVPQIKEKKLSVKEDEQSAKAQLWKALATHLSQGNSSKTHTEGNGNIKQVATLLEDRAFVFGRTVADSLLQCDTKDWPRLKKKIMDIFFEHEEQKSSSNSYYQTSPPCSTNSSKSSQICYEIYIHRPLTNSNPQLI